MTQNSKNDQISAQQKMVRNGENFYKTTGNNTEFSQQYPPSGPYATCEEIYIKGGYF